MIMFIILIRMHDDKLQAITDYNEQLCEESIFEYESYEEALRFTENSALLKSVAWQIVEALI